MCLGYVPLKTPVSLSELALPVYSKVPLPPKGTGEWPLTWRRTEGACTSCLPIPILGLCPDNRCSTIFQAYQVQGADGFQQSPPASFLGILTHYNHSVQRHRKCKLRGLDEPILTTESAPQEALPHPQPEPKLANCPLAFFSEHNPLTDQDNFVSSQASLRALWVRVFARSSSAENALACFVVGTQCVAQTGLELLILCLHLLNAGVTDG